MRVNLVIKRNEQGEMAWTYTVNKGGITKIEYDCTLVPYVDIFYIDGSMRRVFTFDEINFIPDERTENYGND